MTSSFHKKGKYLFTSESVSAGHPDKLADQISDACLDEFLKDDPYSRVAIETLVTKDTVVLAGEVRGSAKIRDNLPSIATKIIKDVGFDFEGFSYKNVNIHNLVHSQSPDIAQGVDNKDKKNEGAGDQGIMFGFACRETESYMPACIYYSHRVLENIFAAKIKGLGPDAKSQVTLIYENQKPIGISKIVVSIQHLEEFSQKKVRELIVPIIISTFPKQWKIDEKDILTNPTGKFVIGGPVSDTGLTGRKIIVDSYGGSAPHGGGAFSGKDPSKVDRSAAYIARYLAKNVVASGVADICTIQLAYAIGVAKPVALYVNSHDTGKINDVEISNILQKQVDLSAWGIREHLGLHKPIYLPTATYGHFGRKPEKGGFFSWEKVDLKF